MNINQIKHHTAEILLPLENNDQALSLDQYIHQRISQGDGLHDTFGTAQWSIQKQLEISHYECIIITIGWNGN